MARPRARDKNMRVGCPWGDAFGPAFQASVERTLGGLPAPLEPNAFVIGAPPGASTPIVEPHDAELSKALERVGAEATATARSMKSRERAKLGLRREEMVVGAVAEALDALDRTTDHLSFCGAAVSVRGVLAVPVVRVVKSAYAKLPTLTTDKAHARHGLYGFSEAVVTAILREAEAELSKPRPGQSLRLFDSEATLRGAGAALMFEVGVAVGEVADAHALFDRLNVISAALYERRVGRGRMIIAREGHPAVTPSLRLTTTASLGEADWARKLLEIADEDLALLTNGATIRGFGDVSKDYDGKTEDVFEVRFVDHYKWELLHADAVLLRVEYGVPGLPRPRLVRGAFGRVFRAVFPNADAEDTRLLYRVVEVAADQPHGTMVVVSARAAEEAARLSGMATGLEPTTLTSDLVRRVTSIDGAVLLDPDGKCHAIGVILDGHASGRGKPSRGARYNSALRYVEAHGGGALAVVVSEDGRVDVVPDGE
jgi:hypothetical protein